MRILLVDDNEAGRPVSTALSEAGFEIAVVQLGRQVPWMIRDFKPDVLLLEVSLPYMNGIAVAGMLREDWPDLPIVIASSGCDPDELELPTKTHFLLKPYPIDSLVEMLYRASSSDL